MNTITDPKIISEQAEDLGGGFRSLTYEIEAVENGKTSILFALVDQDKDLVVYRRAGVTDPIQEDINCSWAKLPRRTSLSDEFSGIEQELLRRTDDLLEGRYSRKYPKRVYRYDAGKSITGDNGKTYESPFVVVRCGKEITYGIDNTAVFKNYKVARRRPYVSSHGTPA